MSYSTLLLLVLPAVLLCSAGCGWHESNLDERAKQIAEERFASLSGDADHFVGLTSARVFGRDVFGLVNGPDILKQGGGARLVAIPFWYAGVLDGREVKRRREFRVRLRPVGDLFDTEHAESSLAAAGELSFVRQALTWLLWSSIGPPFLWLWLCTYAGSGIPHPWINVVSRVASVPIALYAAFVCFGTWLAVAVCLGLHVIMVLAFFAALRAILGEFRSGSSYSYLG